MDTPGRSSIDSRRLRHLPPRRAVLAGGLAATAALVGTAVGVERGDLPGRPWLSSHLGLNGPPGQMPDVTPGPMVSGTLTSRARLGARCGWTIARPPGADGRLPVLVVLHGRGADHRSALGGYLGLERFLARAVAAGAAPFAIASVDGGDTYWHHRTSGEDAGAMVTDEFLPLLGREGLDTRRFALLGWSMGGYGALLLASRLGNDRVAAVVAESPALWREPGETAPGAYDDAADFRAHTLFGRQHALAGIPLRVDCGTGDPFYPATRSYVAGLSPHPAGGFQPGGHDPGYWRRMAPAQLAFVARHLAPPT